MIAKCPPEYVHRGGTYDCYLFHSWSKRTWPDANAYCLREAGNIVKIETFDMAVSLTKGLFTLSVFAYATSASVQETLPQFA